MLFFQKYKKITLFFSKNSVFYKKIHRNLVISQKNTTFAVRIEIKKAQMAQHNILGHQGEELAVTFLEEKGYTILDRNWKLGDLETDIVAKQDDEIVFVEVKTRASLSWGAPEEAVDELRKRRMTAAANAYLKFHRLDNPFRFDIIAIVLNQREQTINHIEQAFSPRPHYIGPGSYNPEMKWSKSRWKRKK